MKTTYLALFSALILLAAGGNSFSQNVSVSPLPATYPDVGSAFTAINGGLHGTGVVNVTITGNTTEAVPAVLNGGIFSQCIVTPFGNITVTGNFNDAVIVLNGADRVTIDGINSMSNSLTITNMNAGLSQGCIRMYNGANLLLSGIPPVLESESPTLQAEEPLTSDNQPEEQAAMTTTPLRTA